MTDKTVLLDVTRMVRRQVYTIATGIDRWDMEVARWLLSEPPGIEWVPVVQLRGRLRRLPGGQKKVARIVEFWSGEVQRPTRIRSHAWTAMLSRSLNTGGIYLNLSHQGLEHPWLWDQLRRLNLTLVVYLHDLIPITHPHTTRSEQPERHRKRVDHIMQSAALILCPSMAVKDEVLSTYSTSASVEPLPPGVSVAMDAEHDPFPRPYAVVLGTLEPRKGHDHLAAIWGAMGEPKPRLVVVGSLGWNGVEIAHGMEIEPNLRQIINLKVSRDDATVQKLVAQSKVLLMPSEAEGWGMPMAEALTLGTPVIATDLPVFQETGQGLAQLLPHPSQPGATQQWADAIYECCQSDSKVTGFTPIRWPTQMERLNALLRKV